MKLSEAIILGDTLKKSDPGEWLTPDGSCGCAFGGALLAAGVNPQEFHNQLYASTRTYEAVSEMPCVRRLWPWITGEQLDEISELYFKVNLHLKTIEDIAAYVRSIEPVELTQEIKEKELQLVS